MKAALILGEQQRTPQYADMLAPTPGNGEQLIRVTASAISHVTKSRASGSHYSSDSAFPFVAGIDGVGVREDGRRVYFILPKNPYGAMADLCVADTNKCVLLPETLDDITAAAIAIPGMSSWAALIERAKLVQGETVLVNGATGTSGRLAVQIAKYLGAGKVIATGRHSTSLQELRSMGADVTVSLTQDSTDLKHAFKREFEQGVDIVLDYLWGQSAQELIASAARFGPNGVPVRFVQIGAASGSEISLPSAALRSSALHLLGSGIGSVPMDRLFATIQALLLAAPSAPFHVATQVMPLSLVQKAWTMDDARCRIVLKP